MKDRRTAAVVVTYNRKDILRQCIRHLLEQEGASCNIIIVDNGSCDGTQDMVTKEFDVRILKGLNNECFAGMARDTSVKICYLNTGSNLGSAGGFNRGIRIAVMAGYDNIWVMDDDVLPDKTALKELLVAARYIGNEWGCLSSYAYWRDGSVCAANRQKKSVFRFLGEDDYKKDVVPAMMISNASMLVNATAVKEMGLPIAEYFFYTDDYEFSARIGEKYRVFVVPKSRVLHAMDVNSKADYIKDTPDRLYRYEYLFRNDVHFYRRYGIKGWLYLLIKLCYYTLYIVICASNKRKRLGVLLKGYRRGLYFRPRIEYV